MVGVSSSCLHYLLNIWAQTDGWSALLTKKSCFLCDKLTVQVLCDFFSATKLAEYCLNNGCSCRWWFFYCFAALLWLLEINRQHRFPTGQRTSSVAIYRKHFSGILGCCCRISTENFGTQTVLACGAQINCTKHTKLITWAWNELWLSFGFTYTCSCKACSLRENSKFLDKNANAASRLAGNHQESALKRKWCLRCATRMSVFRLVGPTPCPDSGWVVCLHFADQLHKYKIASKFRAWSCFEFFGQSSVDATWVQLDFQNALKAT